MRTGIRDFRQPVTLSHGSRVESVIAVVSLNVVGASPEFELGTLGALFGQNSPIGLSCIAALTRGLANTAEAVEAEVGLAFTYFVDKQAPASGKSGFVDYDCSLSGHWHANNNIRLTLEVTAPVTILCPLSKELSDTGAHNQRGFVRIRVASGPDRLGNLWFDHLIEVAERSASSEMYSLLKRQDERVVTMNAYDRPRSVDEIARLVLHWAEAESRIDSLAG